MNPRIKKMEDESQDLEDGRYILGLRRWKMNPRIKKMEDESQD